MCAHVRLAACVLVFWASPAAAQSSIYASGPYLEDLTSSSVTVRTETESAEQLTLTVEPGHRVASDPAPLAGVHSLAVSGLDSKTTYHYSVATSRGGKEEGAFTTAPSDGDVSDVRFVLFGDDRGGYATHELLVRRVVDEPTDFLINTGDLVADGRIGSLWERFFGIEDRLLRDHCMFTAIGNHELVQEDGASYLKYFGTPDEQRAHVFYTTFRWGFLRFFVLNGEGSFLGEDRAWLERELAKADAEPGIAWRIVVVHDGPFSSGLHGDNDKMQGADIPKLLRDHHVDFVLSGHDHLYERGASDGLRYVVSGGAGAPLYPIRHLRATTRKIESVFHYVVFVMSPEKGEIVAKRLDGSVIERVGFTKHDMWDDDGPTIGPPALAASAAPGAPAAPGAAGPENTPSNGRGAYVVVGVAAAALASVWLARRRGKGPAKS